MRILFAINKSYLPEAYGGTELSTHDLCLLLSRRGHEVAVAAMLGNRSLFSLKRRVVRKIKRAAFSVDTVMQYPVFRSWDIPATLPDLVHSFRPDVAIVQGIGHPMAIARALLKLQIPTAVYLRVINFMDHGQPFEQMPGMAYIANSNFTARRFREQLGMSATVIPPIVVPDHYRTPSARTHVLFVNPRPVKGSALACDLARRLPHIPFLFVESWPIPRGERTETRRSLGGAKNVTWLKPVRDMRAIYGKTRLVIIPSEWEEAWGRIATEAGFSAIPAIARAVGGLPESVGSGGLLIPPEASVDDWAQTVKRLYAEPEYYSRLVAASAEFSQRPESSPTRLAQQLEQTLHGLIHAAPWAQDVMSELALVNTGCLEHVRSRAP